VGGKSAHGRAAGADLGYATTARVEAGAEQDDLVEAGLQAFAHGIVDVPRAQPHAVAKERELEEALRGFGRVGSRCCKQGCVRIVEQTIALGQECLFGAHHGDRERGIRDAQRAGRALHVGSPRRGWRCGRSLFLRADVAKGLLVALARLSHAGVHDSLEMARHVRLLQPRARTPLLANVDEETRQPAPRSSLFARARTVGGRPLRGEAGTAGQAAS
jgi:hypothetical protein